MFNALKYIKNLEDVGFPREQAEAQVQLVIDSFQDNVATKSDFADLKSEMAQFRSEVKAEFAEIRAEIAQFKSDVKAEFAEIRAEIAEMKTDLVFRLGGLIVLCTGILGFLIKS